MGEEFSASSAPAHAARDVRARSPPSATLAPGEVPEAREAAAQLLRSWGGPPRPLQTPGCSARGSSAGLPAATPGQVGTGRRGLLRAEVAVSEALGTLPAQVGYCRRLVGRHGSPMAGQKQAGHRCDPMGATLPAFRRARADAEHCAFLQACTGRPPKHQPLAAAPLRGSTAWPPGLAPGWSPAPYWEFLNSSRSSSSWRGQASSWTPRPSST